MDTSSHVVSWNNSSQKQKQCELPQIIVTSQQCLQLQSYIIKQILFPGIPQQNFFVESDETSSTNKDNRHDGMRCCEIQTSLLDCDAWSINALEFLKIQKFRHLNLP